MPIWQGGWSIFMQLNPARNNNHGKLLHSINLQLLSTRNFVGLIEHYLHKKFLGRLKKTVPPTEASGGV